MSGPRRPPQPGVVYMPVPRCDACRWWTPPSLAPMGRCVLSMRPEGKLSVFARGLLAGAVWTAPDFGCVQWKGKT